METPSINGPKKYFRHLPPPQISGDHSLLLLQTLPRALMFSLKTVFERGLPFTAVSNASSVQYVPDLSHQGKNLLTCCLADIAFPEN